MAIQQLANETKANSSLADYELWARNRQIQYRSLLGLNAREGWDQYQNEVNAKREEIRKGLNNPAAQRMFDVPSRRIMNTELGIGADHAATQTRMAATNARSARIDSAQASASTGTEDDLNNVYIPRIRSLVQANGEDAGADPEVIKSQSFREESKARARFIEELARRDPVKANQMLDTARTSGQIHSLDLPQLENIVHSNLDRTATRSFVHGALNEIRNPEGWLSSRGAPRERGVDPDFGQRLTAALTAAETATGQKAQVNSLVRTNDEQAELYQRYKEGTGGLAAAPGTSRHEFGRAADIQSGPVLDWLHKHAGEYGLEFLPGWRPGETSSAFAKDSGHIQLSDAKPLRELPAYSISERQFTDMALSKARAAGISDAGILDRVESGAMTEWRRQKNMDDVENQRNVNTVLQAMDRPQPPQTLEELLKTGPDVSSAWENLPWKTKDQIRRMVEKDPVTDLAERDRLRGMANDPEQIGQFVSSEMHDYILGNSKLSKADKKSLLDLQQQKKVKMQADVAVSHAWGQVENSLPDSIRDDKDQRAIFKGALQRVMEEYQQIYGKPLGGKDLQDAAQRLKQNYSGGELMFKGLPLSKTIPDWRLLFKSSTGPLYAQTPSSADYDRIKQDSIKKKGYEPSDEMINQIYVMELYDKLYGKK